MCNKFVVSNEIWMLHSLTWANCSVNITPKNRCHQGQKMLVGRASASGNDTLRWAGQANAFGMCSHGHKLTFHYRPDLRTTQPLERQIRANQDKSIIFCNSSVQNVLAKRAGVPVSLADLCSSIEKWHLLSFPNRIRIGGTVLA